MPPQRRITLETSVAIDIFKGTTKGEKANALLENATLFISTITHHEVARWCSTAKLSNDESKRLLRMLDLPGQTIPVSRDIAVRAARLRENRPSMSMADALILATAVETQSALLTTDNDFRQNHVNEVEVITL